MLQQCIVVLLRLVEHGIRSVKHYHIAQHPIQAVDTLVGGKVSHLGVLWSLRASRFLKEQTGVLRRFTFEKLLADRSRRLYGMESHRRCT